ncbi:type II CRISPR-associated endonuclease Cas1 [Hoeflea poritis]|uniref:Type II CRISPR-associated endonuclease Cas1 n=1 Tax=Hoeflea poritis TaxID=2993659 RepID=A0ABT4VS85_9HYPH|nr:type II CRISPR-associated endonuclease Cas1 [Hoeflea poritis]MDA4847544.1 type II CRISPR-associated endonuclease Cas1 [Hoeflea poritis]
MDRIVDISTEDLHLGVYRGFLTIVKDREEIGRIALDDIGGLITHAHGLTWSNTVFVRLSECNIPVVICAPNHAPVTCLWPIEGHHLQGARMRAQANAKLPLKKQAWQKIVAAKIRNQGAVLQSAGHEAGAFEMLARKVRSGDPDNLEAQAARRYWPMLMGEEFRRNRDGGGVNGLLNYGYTVLRAIISRAICAAGLHPTLAIHHSNQANAFALADDLMEPYRPLVDRMALNLAHAGKTGVDGETKQALANLGTLDLDTAEGTSPLNVQASRLVHSLATSFTDGSVKLDLPHPPAPLVLAGLGLEAE